MDQALRNELGEGYECFMRKLYLLNCHQAWVQGTDSGGSCQSAFIY